MMVGVPVAIAVEDDSGVVALETVAGSSVTVDSATMTAEGGGTKVLWVGVFVLALLVDVASAAAGNCGDIDSEAGAAELVAGDDVADTKTRD